MQFDQRGNSSEAKSLAEQAVKINPYHADAYALLAKVAKPGGVEAVNLSSKPRNDATMARHHKQADDIQEQGGYISKQIQLHHI